MTDQVNHCDTCPGGLSKFCHFEHKPHEEPWIFVVGEKPLHIYPSKKGWLESRFHKYGVPLDRLLWTSLVKCNDKRASDCINHCTKWLDWQIQQYKPALVLTVGRDAYEHFVGKKDAVKSVGTVRLMKRNDQPFWHMHLEDPLDIDKFPEREYFQNWAISKINRILNGEYPKNPTKDKDYRYVWTKNDVQAWCDEFQHAGEFIALDTETAGRNEYGKSVATDPYHPNSWVISLQATITPGHSVFYDDERGSPEARKTLLDFAKTKLHIWHNAVHDLKFIREKWHENLWPWFAYDTMLADHALREWDRTRNLKKLADLFLPEFEDYEQPLEKWFIANGFASKNMRDYSELPRDLLASYGAIDTDVLLRLFHMQCKEIEEAGMWELVSDHIRRTNRVYGDDMHHGWGVSKTTWQELRAKYMKQRQSAIAELRGTVYWDRWRGHKEVDLKSAGLRFYDSETQTCYDSSEMTDTWPDAVTVNGRKREYVKCPKSGPNKGVRSPIGKWTYTQEDLVPDPGNRAFVADVLYGESYLNLPVDHHTKGGDEATHEVAMVFLKKKHSDRPEVTQVIDAFRNQSKAEKFLGTFIEPVFDRWKDGEFQPGYVKSDGMIHPQYLMAGGENIDGGTTSGRISCKDPNQTNIPSRDKNGKLIKRIYVPVPRDIYGNVAPALEDWYILQLDYSQLELRVLADLSRDPFMVDAYIEGLDLHTQLASARFGKPIEWFKERLDDHEHPEYQQAYEWRAAAKTSWFAFIYGAGPSKLVETLAKQDVWFTTQEMMAIIKGLRQMLPMVERLRQETIQQAPVAYTRFRRRRYCPNVRSTDRGIRDKAFRQLFNFRIQSEGADICSRGMYLAAEWLREQRQYGIRAYAMGNVYDSFILACPKSELDYVAYNVREKMENPQLPWNPVIPFKVDVEFGPSWGKLQGWSYAA